MSSPRAPWWMYFIAACLVGCYAFKVCVLVWGPETPLSGLYNFRNGAIVVSQVVPNSAAARAGVQPGDRILAIDGRPVRGLADWDVLRINFETDHAYPMEVERDGRRMEQTLTLQRRSMNRLRLVDLVGTFVYMIDGLIILLLAILVGFTRPHDSIARLGALALGLIGSGVFSVMTGWAAMLRKLPLAFGVLAWWPSMAWAIFPPLFFAFCAIFPRRLFRARWIWPVALAPYFLFTPVIPLFFLVTFINPRPAVWNPGGFLGPDLAPRIGGSLLLAYIVAGLLCLVLNYRRLEVNDRRRVRVLVGGTVLSFAGWIPTGVLYSTFRASPTGAARFFFQPEYVTFAGVLFLALPFSWTYAILRHRLFDIRVIVRSGLQYALARRVLMTAVPVLGGLLVLDLLLHGDQPLMAILRARGWAYIALGAGAAIAFVKRQSWLESLDRRFFRERYDAQRLLREVVEELRGSRSFEEVSPRVVSRIEAALHPSFVALLLRQPQEPNYRCSTVAPPEYVLPVLAAESKLMALVRLLGKPLEVPQSASSWLQEQLPQEETEFLRRARIELVVPIVAGKEHTEALLVLGRKRSEEPYAREDQDLLLAIASSLTLLLQQPASSARADIFEECPRCGTCYDNGVGQCSAEGARLVPVVLPRLLEGRYRLERRLGRGGMGTVYLASDNTLERRVAVKVIREDLLGNADAAERFRREARAAASFTHPNVVTVHDFGIAAGARAFLVMELLEGSGLREELRQRKRLPPQRVAGILQGVCAALEAAHRRQLVHRDLKPENIFLVADGSGEVAKLLDFGLAKFLTSMAMQPTADTASGVVMGTLRYMSPEQRRAEEAHPSWDLWALSIASYEMLTGAYPFGEGSVDGSSSPLVTPFVPTKTHVADAPDSWQQFFEGCFARNRERRPQSAGEFLSQLQHALGLSQSGQRAP